MVVVLLLLLTAQDHPWPDPVYQNSDAPNCGSYFMRDLHGDVFNQIEEPIKDALVYVYGEASHTLLEKTVTDDTGKFSLQRMPPGLYRVVASSPGYRNEDWAVTIARWPSGGLFRTRSLRMTLRLPVGDDVPICRSVYSKR